MSLTFIFGEQIEPRHARKEKRRPKNRIDTLIHRNEDLFPNICNHKKLQRLKGAFQNSEHYKKTQTSGELRKRTASTTLGLVKMRPSMFEDVLNHSSKAKTETAGYLEFGQRLM